MSTLSGICRPHQTVSPIAWHHFPFYFRSEINHGSRFPFDSTRLGLGTVKRWHEHGRLDPRPAPNQLVHVTPLRFKGPRMIVTPSYERKTDKKRIVPLLHPLSRCVRRQISALSGDRSGAPLEIVFAFAIEVFSIVPLNDSTCRGIKWPEC